MRSTKVALNRVGPSKLASRSKRPASDFNPKVYDIWYFGGLNLRYGKPHPGSLPGDYVERGPLLDRRRVIQLLILSLAEVLQLCLREMKRVCFASDIDHDARHFQVDMQHGLPTLRVAASTSVSSTRLLEHGWRGYSTTESAPSTSFSSCNSQEAGA